MKMQNESSAACSFTLFNSFAQPHQNPIKEPIHFDWQVQFFSSKLFFLATSPNSDWSVDLIGQRSFLEVGDSQVQSEKSRLF